MDSPVIQTVFGRIDDNILYTSQNEKIVLHNRHINKVDATYILIRKETNGHVYVVDWY